MYMWRKLTAGQRDEALRLRRQCGFPWHGPPHFQADMPGLYHLTAACYEHRPIVGYSPGRMASFEAELVALLGAESRSPDDGTTSGGVCSIGPEASPGIKLSSREEAMHCELRAWCVLPNHWHAVVRTDGLKHVVRALGRLHGRFAYRWNGEENKRGRTCWHRCADRHLRSEAHYWATLNYVHHNPVHHGYAERWQEWPYSSATGWIEKVGEEKAKHLWGAFPVLEYGRGWDEPGM